ncbi:MAG: hypothetical protein WCH43_14090 [Verrucomicrobiota bacterium]
MTLPIGQEVITATIASGQSLSDPIALGAKTLVAVAMPTTWTTAPLSFMASVDGTNWLEVYTNVGANLSLVAAAGRLITTDISPWLGLNLIKVRSGSVDNPISQGADRVLGLVIKPV